MTSYYSVGEAIAEYRQAIVNNREQLQSFFLDNRPWGYLEKKGVFEVSELETMKKKPRKIAIPMLLTTVLEKNNIETFMAFSKALYTMAPHMGRQVFPFADRAGGIPVSKHSRDDLQPSCGKPIILWVVSSKEDYEVVTSIIGSDNVGTAKYVSRYHCQEFFISHEKLSLVSTMSIHVAYPRESEASCTTSMRDLLVEFSPQPHVAVMSGVCCANEGEANLGDVVVTTLRDPTALSTELQHVTELWKIENEKFIYEEIEQPPPRSFFQQMVCLARVYAELQLPEEERSQWGLDLDLAKPLKDNRGVRLCVPDPEQLWQSEEATGFWSLAENDQLPYVPCERLLNEAKGSMVFASESVSHFFEPPKPEIIFGRADIFKGREGRAICNPQVVNFHTAGSMLKGSQYLAVLGVSSVNGQDCKEKEYEKFASHLSAHIMWKIVKHLAQKLCL